MSRPSDGGRRCLDCARAAFSRKGRRAPYLVRSIKPNPIASHDWHVQPICQRSFGLIRLSGTLGDRGPGCDAGVSSNLLRLPDSAFDRIHRRFCANLLKLPDFHIRVKLNRPSTGGRSNSMLAVVPRVRISTGREGKSPIPRRRATQISKIDRQKNTRAARAHRRKTPGSCNGLFSAGFPTGVSGALASPDPAN